MKKSGPTFRTAIMGLFAGAMALIAAYYYPWPKLDQSNAMEGQGLFKDFADKEVNFIEVEAFNSDTQTLERLNLHRRGEKWMLPNFSNYNADRVAQISAAINCLRKTVLEVVSDEVEDHSKFGVVDPLEFQSTANKSVLGHKITLLNSDRSEIASLIVGLEPQDATRQGQRYVRIAGQPGVFLAEYSTTQGEPGIDDVLSTKLSNWVDSNLFKIGTDIPLPQSMIINHYQLAGDGKRQNFYRAELKQAKDRYRLNSLEMERESEWQKITPTDSDLAALENGIRYITNLNVIKILPKSPSLATAWKNPNQPADVETLNADKKLGFVADSEHLFPTNLISVGGRIDILINDNIQISLLLGVVDSTNQTDSKLCRWAAVIATPLADKLEKPTEPQGVDGQKATEDQMREFAVAMRDWEQKTKAAESVADTFNSIHANWIFAIDEGVVLKIRPEISLDQSKNSVESKAND